MYMFPKKLTINKSGLEGEKNRLTYHRLNFVNSKCIYTFMHKIKKITMKIKTRKWR